MRKLSFFVIAFFAYLVTIAQSPHGDDFNIDCALCHSPESWELLKEDMQFDHSQTDFDLIGQHKQLTCKACHVDLNFSTAANECVSCHTDRHNNTLGMDCARCHTPASWLVSNVRKIHDLSRFPLQGAHATADCYSCHESASNLQFEPLGVACVDCHLKDFMATTSPNHQQSGYSTDCVQCHSAKAIGWRSANFEHNFFPLNGGHAISCAECHTSGTFEKIDNACFVCHQTDYTASLNPKHQQLNFSTNCAECHDLTPGWSPAEFKQHDAQFFPIYSGEHHGEWNSCTECHTNSASYAEFSCTTCHEHNQSEMDDEHGGVNGYSYKSNLCYSCHPTGRESGAFNHSSTGFSLLGVHATTDCIGCHADGFANTSSACVDCHQPDYTQTSNPNHQNLSLAVTCADCHTSDPDWQPASFPVHSEFYALAGAHATIANDCAVCHNGNYTTTEITCYGCHTENYNSTTDPNHQASGFPTDCASCHTTNNWEGASFDHNTTGFALTGAHTATSCVDCHAGNYTNTPSTCFDCHDENYNSTTDPNHQASGFPTDCASCHTTNNWEGASFNHDATGFALTGAHTATSCVDCHAGNYTNTPNTCYECHTDNYNSTTDPNHLAANFPTDCESCHTTNAWEPSTFNHDAQYFPIYSGKHGGEWNSCTECHQVASNFASFTCLTCHEHSQSRMDDEHSGRSGYSYNSAACLSCHPQGRED
jgi:nitrate/TMAO reductase-like tetraheme cytochrome c subunit